MRSIDTKSACYIGKLGDCEKAIESLEVAVILNRNFYEAIEALNQFKTEYSSS